MQNAAASAANHRTIQDAHGQRRGRVFTCIICPTGLLRAVTQVLNPQGPRIACESGHNYSFGTQLAIDAGDVAAGVRGAARHHSIPRFQV